MFRHLVGGTATAAILSSLALATAQSADWHFPSEAEPTLPVPAPVEELQLSSRNLAPTFKQPVHKENRIESVTSTATILRPASPRSVTSGIANYFVQAGSFVSFENAQALNARLHSIGPSEISHRHVKGRDFYAVFLGPWQSEADAQTALSLARQDGLADGFIVTAK